MNFITNLFTPSVESAARSLNKALVQFEKAQALHNQKATRLAEAAATMLTQANVEAEAASRATRIGAKLADLLA